VLRQATDTIGSVKGFNVLDNPHAVLAQAREVRACCLACTVKVYASYPSKRRGTPTVPTTSMAPMLTCMQVSRPALLNEQGPLMLLPAMRRVPPPHVRNIPPSLCTALPLPRRAAAGSKTHRALRMHARATQAEAKSHSSTMGMFHNEATVFSVASDSAPGARSSVATHDGEAGPAGRASSAGGSIQGSNFEAFGPVALSATSTGARAVSASHAIALVRDHAPSQAAHGATSSVYEHVALRAGSGKMHDVFTDSVGVTEIAPSASAISNVGGGPVAIAQANEAVALANADTPRNSGGLARRRRRLLWRPLTKLRAAVAADRQASFVSAAERRQRMHKQRPAAVSREGSF
jgi:hypothetical protein